MASNEVSVSLAIYRMDGSIIKPCEGMHAVRNLFHLYALADCADRRESK